MTGEHAVSMSRGGGPTYVAGCPVLLAAQEPLLAQLSKSERVALLNMLVRVIEANDTYARPGNGRRKPSRKSGAKSIE